MTVTVPRREASVVLPSPVSSEPSTFAAGSRWAGGMTVPIFVAPENR